MIQAVIFDLDGLIIDSEPLWQAAEMEVFQKLGVPITLDTVSETKGLRNDETVDYWYQRNPWKSPPPSEVVNQIEQAVINLIHLKATPKAGVHEAINEFQTLKLRLALASSSSTPIIDAALTKLSLVGKFETVHSAESEPYGKPHPAVYITTANKLGVSPRNCLALEDSINGVISAKAAEMRCIAVPSPEARYDRRFEVADLIVGSLNEITEPVIEQLRDTSI